MQRVLDQEPRERFGRVVGGRFLAVAAGQAVDEGALLDRRRASGPSKTISLRAEFADPAARARNSSAPADRPCPVADTRLLRPRSSSCRRLPPRSSSTSSALFDGSCLLLFGRRRTAALLRAQLDQVLLGDDAGERDQGFVDRAELADTELRVGNPPVPLPGLLQRKQADDLLYGLVAKLDRVQDRRAFGSSSETFTAGRRIGAVSSAARRAGRASAAGSPRGRCRSLSAGFAGGRIPARAAPRCCSRWRRPDP